MRLRKLLENMDSLYIRHNYVQQILQYIKVTLNYNSDIIMNIIIECRHLLQ